MTSFERLGPVARKQRRAFLASMAGMVALPWLGSSRAGRALLEVVSDDFEPTHEVLEDFWSPLSGDRTVCRVCPFDCILQDGETCFCLTRTNRGGRLYTTGNSGNRISWSPWNRTLPSGPRSTCRA